MKHIETIELGSSQASITFSSIPQDYDDLVLVVNARTTDTSTLVDPIFAAFNGVATNYSFVELVGDGSSVFTDDRSEFYGAFANTNSSTSNTFGNSSLYLSNYTASSAKSGSLDAVTENNATESYQQISAQLWDNTAAITSIVLTSKRGADFMANSTFSLYGVTAGGDGTVTSA